MIIVSVFYKYSAFNKFYQYIAWLVDRKISGWNSNENEQNKVVRICRVLESLLIEH